MIDLTWTMWFKSNIIQTINNVCKLCYRIQICLRFLELVVYSQGFVKQKVYDPSTDMVQLKMPPISQQQAKQRSGRAGRIEHGKCYRMYTRHAIDHHFCSVWQFDAITPWRQISAHYRFLVNHSVCVKMLKYQNHTVLYYFNMYDYRQIFILLDFGFRNYPVVALWSGAATYIMLPKLLNKARKVTS